MGIVYPMLSPSNSVLGCSLTPPSSLSPWQACEPKNTRGNKNKQYYDMNLIFMCPCNVNIIPNYNQQDATFSDLFISTAALHVSGGSQPIIRST
jgi:hypothetical protein